MESIKDLELLRTKTLRSRLLRNKNLEYKPFLELEIQLSVDLCSYSLYKNYIFP